MTKAQYKIFWRPQLENGRLLVFWDEEYTFLKRAVDELERVLESKIFCRLNPVDYFNLDGVIVHDDVAALSEAFFSVGKDNIVLFKSASPQMEWFRFFEQIFDISKKYCSVKTIFTVGRMVSLGSHLAPRNLIGLYNDAVLRDELMRFNLAGDMDFSTEPGQRPSLNSFLNWAALKKHIPAAGIWVSVPFYLSSVGDARADKAILEFFDAYFGLRFDYSVVDRAIKKQDKILSKLFKNSIDAGDIMERIEAGEQITDEESYLLVSEVEEIFYRNR